MAACDVQRRGRQVGVLEQEEDEAEVVRSAGEAMEERIARTERGEQRQAVREPFGPEFFEEGHGPASSLPFGVPRVHLSEEGALSRHPCDVGTRGQHGQPFGPDGFGQYLESRGWGNEPADAFRAQHEGSSRAGIVEDFRHVGKDTPQRNRTGPLLH
jgi:hypothetical protein